MGGLIVATALTLLFLPALYAAWFGMREEQLANLIICAAARTAPMPADLPILWSSRLAFYLATVGAAVGLGSIWRLPYLVGSSGGSAFVFVFTAACVLIATPLLAAECLLGRHSRLQPARRCRRRGSQVRTHHAVERDRRARHHRDFRHHVLVYRGGRVGARLHVEVRERRVGGPGPAGGCGPLAHVSVQPARSRGAGIWRFSVWLA